MTMDILWAISHPPSSTISAAGYDPYSMSNSYSHPPPSDEEFVGGVQFWGYGLVSGSGDGAVRMWDSESFLRHFVRPR
jgi:mitochondrial division protein 1